MNMPRTDLLMRIAVFTILACAPGFESQGAQRRVPHLSRRAQPARRGGKGGVLEFSCFTIEKRRQSAKPEPVPSGTEGTRTALRLRESGGLHRSPDTG